MNRSVREVLLFHAGFGLLATGVVLATPAAQFGRWAMVLAIAYNLLLPLYAMLRGEHDWVGRWLFMLGVSALTVLPDWVRVSVTETLHFHDHGIDRIGGAVPLYFVGLWVMILFPVTLMADQGRSARYLVAALLGGLVFTAAEWMAGPLRLWSPRNVDTLAGFALYPIPAEMALCVAALWLYRSTAHTGLFSRLWAVSVAPVYYTGALMLSLLWLT